MKLLNQNYKTLKNLLFCGLEIEIKKLRLNRYYLLLILIKLTCGHDVVSDYGEHFYHEGKCRLCGAFQPVTEEDLVFNLIEDGTAYEVGQSRFTEANLNILSTHNGLPVTRISYGAFYAGYNLYSVVIPDSVTSIGGNAFYSCKNLASLTLGNGVTTIEYGAFFNCYRLTSITIPASLTTIGQYGFLDCISLVEIINNSELPLVEGSEDYGYLLDMHYIFMKKAVNLDFLTLMIVIPSITMITYLIYRVIGQKIQIWFFLHPLWHMMAHL